MPRASDHFIISERRNGHWSNSEAVHEARRAYDAGLIEMAQRTDGDGVSYLYAIPRVTKAHRGPLFSNV